MTHLRPMELLSRSSSLVYHDHREATGGTTASGETDSTADSNTLVLEIVALCEIAAGDEIYIDYGADWDRAWNDYVQQWESEKTKSELTIGARSITNKSFDVSAREWLAIHNNDPWRTSAEQVTDPYPENLQTACFVSVYRYFDELQDSDPDADKRIMEWSHSDETSHMSCLRPCSIVHRIDIDGVVNYHAIVYPMKRFEEPEECGGENMPTEGLAVEEIPVTAVTLIDAPYSSDMHQPWAFRHTIGVPANFLSSDWIHADPNPSGKPGSHLRIESDSNHLVCPELV
jgi:hypothetical protein